MAVQVQTGTQKGKWLHSGVVVEALGNDSYVIKLDESGRITKRRRQFLKSIKTFLENYKLVPTGRNCQMLKKLNSVKIT